MRLLVAILIIAAFLQTTFLPLNLVLLILILRSYIKVDKQNLILAFGFGILISLLEQNPLGIHSIIYLFLVQLTHLLAKTPISRNLLGVVPLTLVLLTIDHLLTSFASGQTIQIVPAQLLVESILSLPIYIVLRVWEERFIVKPDIKLKI